jgi:two-component system OmpR family sensor kinase
MGSADVDSTQRLLDTLEQLLKLPTADLRTTLSRATDLVAEATAADKVDAFLYDPARDTLVATGSNQPLSAVQRQHGLDVLALANGGRVVYVYKTGKVFVSGRVDQDPEELLGIKQTLGIRSQIGVALEVGGTRRGMMMLASQEADFFTPDDVRFAESAGRWIGAVAHRAELAGQISRNAMEQGRRAAAEELVTVLAHDLRNYLAPIEMRLHALRLRAEQASRKDEMREMDLIHKSLQRLSTMVSDILDVSRLDEGVFRFEPHNLDAVALLKDIASAFSTPQQPVVVREQAAAPIRITADPARIRQCVENLLSNAIKKSPLGAEVTVLVRSETRSVGDSGTAAVAVIEVIDQGPGIPEELLPHVFERFATGRGREGGFGLGLYLAKRIAVMHGGDLEVDSQPGKGARFALTVPSSDPPSGR